MRSLALAAILAGVLTAGGSAAPTPSGGTYRVGWEIGWKNDFEWGVGLFSNGFDPTGETAAFAIYTNLVVRTLVGYDHVAGADGDRLVPDLAARVPTPTNGGRRYVFTLRRGPRFGPPVHREITSRDVRYAIERLARPRNTPPPVAPWPRPGRRAQAGDVRAGREYAGYFRVVRGFDRYRAGRAPSISGISTPDARTIAFDLIRPAGDFLHRLALPAAAPIPPEVGRCFEGRPGRYGADLVSSGPYMIEGAEDVRIATCAAIRPMRGISADRLVLVRNPRYDPRTDRAAARESNPDRFVFLGGLTATEILARLRSGDLDDAVLTSSAKVLGPSAATARRSGRLRVHSADWLLYIALNLTQPPFDDVHVRRALSWAMDKAALREAWGGPLAGPIAEHVVPDRLLGGRLAAFAPFRTPRSHGDLARAREELAKSRYASRAGVCTAKACKGVHRNQVGGPTVYAAGGRLLPVVESSAAKLGITFTLRGTSNRLEGQLSAPGSWIKDVPDAATYLEPLLARTAIAAGDANGNHSLVGITAAQAATLRVSGRVEHVPSVDADLARCGGLRGTERLDCYARLDRRLSTEIVPWIPFLWRSHVTILGPQVAKWEFDQSTGVTAFAHVALRR